MACCLLCTKATSPSKTVHNTPMFIVYSQCPSLMYLPTPSNVTSSNNCFGFSFSGKASSLDGGFNLDSNFSRKPTAAAIFSKKMYSYYVRLVVKKCPEIKSLDVSK